MSSELKNRIAAHIPTLTSAIASAQHILVLTHINPDGDAIGCALGIWHVVRALGKQASILLWPGIPKMAIHMPGSEHLQVYAPGDAPPPGDLVILVDTSDRRRVGRLIDDYPDLFEQRSLVMIDHHQTAVAEGMVAIIEPTLPSCAELVYAVVQALGAPLTPAAATCLLLGVMSDTQSFQTSGTTGETLLTAGALLQAGADQRLVVRAISEVSFANLELLGLSLAQLQRDRAIVWTALTQEMLAAAGVHEDAGDEVINLMRRVEGMRVCALFKERADGTVKISLRAAPGVDVASIAQIWGGGGHTLAAGATLTLNLAAAQDAVLGALRAALYSE